MNVLLLISILISCSSNKNAPRIQTSLNSIEKENLNTFLNRDSFKLYDFGTLKLRFDEKKPTTVKISDIYAYSYNNLKSKDEGKMLLKPKWLKTFNNQGVTFQEIFEKAEAHLSNLAYLIKSPNYFTNIPGLCCVADRLDQLNNLRAQYLVELDEFKPDSYNSSYDYLKANWYWAFTDN